MEDTDFIADAKQPVDSDFFPDPPKDPNTAAMKSYVKQNVAQHFASEDPEEKKSKKEAAHTAEGFYEALLAGYEGSATGLAIRRKLPEHMLPEHASTAFKIASQIGSLADLPMMAASGLAAAETGPVGAAATAFAVPAAVRKILMDHYEKGDIQTAEEFASRLMSTTWETIKGATTGGVTAITGGAAGAVGGPLVQKAAEVLAMTATASALEGELPEVSDLVSGAIVVGGLHGVGVLKPKLANMYAATGEKPAEVATRAQNDVILKQELIAGNLNEPVPPVKIGPDNKVEIKPLTPEDLAPKPEPASDIPRTEDEKLILSKIGKSTEAPDKTLKEKWQEFNANKLDKNAPLKYAIEEAEKRGAEIAPQDDASLAAARFAAYQDRISSFYEHGTRDFETGKVNGEGLSQIYADVPNKDMDGFRAYGMAARGLELKERGIQPWKDFDAESAKRVVEAGKDSYEEVNRRRVDFKNRVLEYVKKSGLIDEEAERRMVEANKQSFPFHRVQEPDVFTGSKSGGAILKRIYGSDKLILDPVLSDYQDTALMIKKAMVNDVRTKFLENMKAGNLVDEGGKIPNPDAYLKRVPEKMLPVTVGSEELSMALEKQGLDLQPDDITVFRPEHGILKENQIAFKVDGKRVVYEGPPGVIESLKALDGDRAATDLWVKFMAGFAKMERIGQTSSPTFGLSHFFRAATMSGVYTKTGQIPFYHAMGVLGDITGKTDLYRDAQYHGAFSKVFEPINDQFLQKNIESAGLETNFAQKAWNVITHPLDASEAWIRLTDSASRLSEYKRAIEQGRTPEEAATFARNVVVDYQKTGLQKMAIRQTTAFIGVHINSMDQLRLAFATDPKSTIARLGMVSAISAALWAVNKDDEAIQATPDWQKSLFWQINLSRARASISGEKYDPKEAFILRLPKPWAAGIAFGTGMELALDVAFADSKNEGKHFAHSLFASIVPEPIPNMMHPIIEQSLNLHLTSGRPLISAAKEKLLPEMRYENYTSESAKQIAKIIGYVPWVKTWGSHAAPLESPIVVENYIRSWTGTLGGLVLKIADPTLKMVGVGNQKPEPESKISDWPFFDSFVSRYPSMKNQNLQDFYENKKQMDLNLNSLKASAKQGDVDEFNKIMREHGSEMAKLDSVEVGITRARNALDIIQYRADIPPVEKRQLMDTITFQIGSMANLGNKIIDTVKNKNKAKQQGENK